MKTILYISDVNADEPIFHSQVLPHVRGLKKHFNILFMGMKRDDDYSYDFAFQSVKGDFHFPIGWRNFQKQKKEIINYLKEQEIDVIFSRGFRGGLLGGFVKHYVFNDRIKLINDVRADVLDEQKDKKLNQFSLYFTIKYVFRKADVAFFVSSYLQDKYRRMFCFEGESAICPTFVPDDKFQFSENIRNSMRAKLGYSKQDVVLLYSGSLSKWQNFDEIVHAFEKTTNLSLRLLVLTKDTDIYERIRNCQKKNNILVKSVDYVEIQNYYYTADYGLLIRDNIPTNICAAPTKFSEYINSGLPVIASRIDSDYCRFLDENELNKYMIEDKKYLKELFDRLALPERENKKINTLSEIIEKQIKLI